MWSPKKNIKFFNKRMRYFVEKTLKTPSIHFENGTLNIEGRSISEDPIIFYEPLIEKIHQYKNNPVKKTVVNIHLDYVNSSSNRALIKLLSLFEDMFKQGNDVVINWLYDKQDEIIYELGKDFRDLIKAPFNLEAYHEN